MNTLFKHLLIATAALFTGPFTAAAQDVVTAHNEQSDKDETFELPEGMVVSEDSLLGDWMAKNYLYPDTTCENPNYNPTYGPEVYEERLLRLPTVIEMTYNDIVQKFIDRYTSKQRRLVSAMLGAANLYVPLFEEALDYYGLPLELKYLPVIESALNPNAVSPAGASGLWQFMVATGKRYDLTINSRIDERRDPIKGTWAAARFLRDLFKIYGDWHLVLAAYNCGPGNVNKAINRADGKRDYWEIYPYLPKETRGYVPAFIAANYVMNYYCDHNICPMLTKYPLQTDTVMVMQNVDMRQVAELCHIDLQVVQALNPQYRTNVIPGYSAPSTLRLPQEDVAKFIALKDTIYGEPGREYLKENASQDPDPRSAFAEHGPKQHLDAPATEPQPATRATTRATRHRTTATAQPVQTTRRTTTPSYSRNRNAQTTAAKRRQTTTRSKAAATTSTKRKATRAKAAAKPQETTIKEGQTLSQIARKHGTTVDKLKKLNNLKGDQIRSGKKLRVK